MADHPELSRFGIGTFDQQRKTRAERDTELAQGRAELAANEPVVLRTAAWLQENVAPIKTPTVGSYTMKHVAERAMGQYVTNGELIAAALVAGYPVKYTDGPNPLLGISARDIKRINTSR